MTARSTRNKIRWGFEAASKNIDQAMDRLQHVCDLADEKVPEIDLTMPLLVELLDRVKALILKMRENI